MRLVLISFLTFFTTAELVAQSRITTNVVYGMYSGLALLGDLHHPAKPNGYGIVVVAGSAFSAPLGLDATPLKDSVSIHDLTRSLVGSGYLVFAVNHRAAPPFQYPAAVEDVQRAVRFLRANAMTHGIDPNRVGAVGGSSGGHLVAMLGTMDAKGDSQASDPLLRESARVQAVVALYAPFDLRLQFTESSFHGVPEALFVGAGLRYGERLHAMASPITHVTADDAPFLLYHGNEDTSVPISQSIAMKAALEKAGVPVSLVTIENGQHAQHFGLPAGDKRLQNYLQEIPRWLDKQLKR